MSGQGCSIFVAEAEKYEKNVKLKNEEGGREEDVGREPSWAKL